MPMALSVDSSKEVYVYIRVANSGNNLGGAIADSSDGGAGAG